MRSLFGTFALLNGKLYFTPDHSSDIFRNLSNQYKDGILVPESMIDGIEDGDQGEVILKFGITKVTIEQIRTVWCEVI